MARVHVMGGYLNVEGMSGGYPDNSLPGVEGPVDPGYGISADRPSNPIVLPPDPPGVWPGPRPSHPIVIAPPGTPPGVIWPTPGAHPDQGLPGAQPRPDQGLPPGPTYPSHPIASQTYWMLCYSPSLGWKYVTVDPSLKPGHDLPAPQPVPTPHK
jgi:hypothetical protein